MNMHQRRVDTREPLLPLAFDEHVELIRAGAAIDAFARRRASGNITHGHTPEADLARAPGQLAGEVQWRMSAFIDIMGRYRMNMPPQRRAQLVRYVETAGGVLISLWDRLQVEVPEE